MKRRSTTLIDRPTPAPEEGTPEEAPAKDEPRAKPKPKALPTVIELARELGEILELRMPNGKTIVTPTARHQAAAALHGWRDHAHHAGSPMTLSREAYQAALAAADAPPHGQRALAPHVPALSPHVPHASGKQALAAAKKD